MTTVCEQHTHICIQTAVYANYNYTVIDQSTRINDGQIENAATVLLAAFPGTSLFSLHKIENVLSLQTANQKRAAHSGSCNRARLLYFQIRIVR